MLQALFIVSERPCGVRWRIKVSRTQYICDLHGMFDVITTARAPNQELAGQRTNNRLVCASSRFSIQTINCSEWSCLNLWWMWILGGFLIWPEKESTFCGLALHFKVSQRLWWVVSCVIPCDRGVKSSLCFPFGGFDDSPCRHYLGTNPWSQRCSREPGGSDGKWCCHSTVKRRSTL